ncbi:MAG: tetratricopeptide repeat protein [Nitrospinae bacterium]|nr:tetratricopeptide repeat protein [Nitrospinota bacterium]
MPTGEDTFFKNKNSTKLIVFIHGINGDPVGTWTNDKTRFFWPEELSKDEEFQDADVWSFGYDSGCGPSFNIREIAKHLETELREKLNGGRYSSISFVAHSMGGLVFREFVLSRYGHLQPAVPIGGAVLLSTPNRGSGLANLVNHVCHGDSLGDLIQGKNDYIDTLNDRWREKYGQEESVRPFRISAGYEIKPIAGLIIVDKDSAAAYASQCLPFKRNHFEIAKPEGRDTNDNLYLWVKQRLLAKPPDPRLQTLTEAQEKRYTEIIEQLQKQLQGTDLQQALKLVEDNKLDDALALLSAREAAEDRAIQKTAQTRFAKAQVYELKLDSPNALKYYETAARLDPENTNYLNQTGFVLYALGQYDRAIEYFERALESDLKTFGPEHPSVANRWNNLGEVWRNKGQYDKAIEYLEKALASYLKTLGPEHPQVAISWNNIGEAWRGKGQYDKAIGYFEKAVESDLKTFGPEHPTVAKDWNNLGVGWHSKEDYGKAIEYLEKALASDLKTLGEDHPNVANRWNNLGGVWHSQGDYSKAIGYFEKALASGLKTFGEDHPYIANRWINLGGAWHSKGDYDRAIEYLEKARAVFQKANLPHYLNIVEGGLEKAREAKAAREAGNP